MHTPAVRPKFADYFISFVRTLQWQKIYVYLSSSVISPQFFSYMLTDYIIFYAVITSHK
jgi:hypothetical protein